MASYIANFSNKSVAVVGFGVEGVSAVNFLMRNGALVTVVDKKLESEFDPTIIQSLKGKGIQFVFGKYPDLLQFDIIVRSPGVSLKNPELQYLLEKGKKITSVTKLFFDLCPCPIIGVTGTKGKGTTATLIYKMLKADGRDAYIGGNIGTPALDFIEKLSQESVVMLELSSFQLIDLEKSPHIAVMLMVTAEHLDYHKDIYEYVEAKRNILKYQTVKDFAVLNKDYPASNESDTHTDAKLYFVSREQEVEQGCYIQNNKVVIRNASQAESTKNKKQNLEEIIIDTKDIALPGKHNWENVCAAVMAATLANVSKESVTDILKTFKGLEHRLELVKTVKGVRYYDDSFSTTPETAQAAILAFEDPEILILGGSSKNSDFTMLGEVIGKSENIKAIIGIGSEWPRIKEQINDWHFQIIEGLSSLDEVVQKAAEVAEPGDVVLLSPACASFDMFKDYKDRGIQFQKAVNSL